MSGQYQSSPAKSVNFSPMRRIAEEQMSSPTRKPTQQNGHGVDVVSSRGSSDSPHTPRESISSADTAIPARRRAATVGQDSAGAVFRPRALFYTPPQRRHSAASEDGPAQSVQSYGSPVWSSNGGREVLYQSPGSQSNGSGEVIHQSPGHQSNGSREVIYQSPGRQSSNERHPVQRRHSVTSAGGPVQPVQPFESPVKSGNRGRDVLPGGSNSRTLFDIPEEQTVTEFAFRQGQLDRGNTSPDSSSVPQNPFASRLNDVWTDHYQRGKASHGDIKALPNVDPSQRNNDRDWSPLINPYTQTLEHPHGHFDPVYVRATCAQALDGMAYAISAVSQQGQRQSDRIVIDVPHYIASAASLFPDLEARYESLVHAAADAKVERGRYNGRYNY